ncbi:hypothetical protein B0H11DRAFT_2232965 [Mycena galericulata]|nr:hypothetical protein B0H11DRAFT_2232965 [Mycena galericulata]
MLTFLVLLGVLNLPFALAAGGAAGFLIVSDPVGAVQCENFTLQWEGGTPPFTVTVEDSSAFSGIDLASWTGIETQSIVWTVEGLPLALALPLPFLVRVVDSAGGNSTSRTESIVAGSIALNESDECTSIGAGDTSIPSSSTTPSPTTPQTSQTSATSDTKSPTSNIGPTKSGASSTSPSSKSPTATSGTSSASASGTVATAKKISSGTIAGAVVGGIALIALLGTTFQVLSKRHQKKLLEDLTKNNYHRALDDRKPPSEVLVEKPLPAFYEPFTPDGTRTPNQRDATGNQQPTIF